MHPRVDKRRKKANKINRIVVTVAGLLMFQSICKEAAKKSFFSGMATKRGGGEMAFPLRKNYSFKLFLSYFKTKKVPFDTELEGGGLP